VRKRRKVRLEVFPDRAMHFADAGDGHALTARQLSERVGALRPSRS
jgi:hypothetical protein